MRRRSGLVRWAVLAVVVMIMVGLAGAILGQLPYPEVSEQHGRIAVAGLAVMLALSVATAERRIRDDLAEREHRSAGGGATAIARTVHGHGVTGLGLAALARAVVRLLAIGSWAVAGGLAFVLSCYAPTAGIGGAAWPVASVAGLLAGWVVARRVTAWQRAGLTVRAAVRSRVGLALVVGVVLVLVIARPLHGPALAGLAALAAVSLAGAYAGRGVAVQARRRRRVVGQLAASLSVAQSTLEDPGKARWTVDRDGAISVSAPLPADVVRGLVGLETRLAEHLPSHEIAVTDPEGGLHLRPAGLETQQRRELVRETGLLTAIEPVDEPGPVLAITAADLGIENEKELS